MIHELSLNTILRELIFSRRRKQHPETNEKETVVAIHKPAGAVSAMKNTFGKQTLTRWLEGVPEGFSCIGRLDKDTTGLLLLTNDGNLSHSICKKGNPISKIYECTIAEAELKMEDERIQRLLNGVQLWKDEPPAKALSIVIHTDQSSPPITNTTEPTTATTTTTESTVSTDGSTQVPNEQQTAVVPKGNKRSRKKWKKQMRQGHGGSLRTTKISIEIQEGRNRVIRRMCKAVQLPLVHLHRSRIGNVDLARLGLANQPGKWVFLDEQTTQGLWQAVGGQHAVVEGQIKALARRARWARFGKGQPMTRLEAWFERHGLAQMLQRQDDERYADAEEPRDDDEEEEEAGE